MSGQDSETVRLRQREPGSVGIHYIPTELTTTKRQPAEMTEHDWNVVLLNNSLLHGLIFDPESKTFKPAREPGK